MTTHTVNWRNIEACAWCRAADIALSDIGSLAGTIYDWRRMMSPEALARFNTEMSTYRMAFYKDSH